MNSYSSWQLGNKKKLKMILFFCCLFFCRQKFPFWESSENNYVTKEISFAALNLWFWIIPQESRISYNISITEVRLGHYTCDSFRDTNMEAVFTGFLKKNNIATNRCFHANEIPIIVKFNTRLLENFLSNNFFPQTRVFSCMFIINN